MRLFIVCLADYYRKEATVMIFKTTSVAFTAACVMAFLPMPAAQAQRIAETELVTNGPQTDAGDVSPAWSARRNVVDSERYDRLLQTSSGFRAARMRQECGPITDPQLHADCLASFNQDEPGSPLPRRRSPRG
jgi:hypothetical protein